MRTSKGTSNVVQVLLSTIQMMTRVLAIGAALVLAVWLMFLGTKKYTDVSPAGDWGLAWVVIGTKCYLTTLYSRVAQSGSSLLG